MAIKALPKLPKCRLNASATMAVFSMEVSTAPVFRSTNPLVSTTSAVSVQTTRVSAKTSKMPHIP